MRANRSYSSVLSFRFALLALVCQLVVGQSAPKPLAADTTDQRIRFFQAQLARDPDYYVNYNRLAGAYALKARETGDISYYELAEKATRKSLDLESQDEEAVTAYGQLGAIQFAEHRFSEAASSAERALKLADDPDALALAGDAQLEMGEYAKAESFFARIAAPNDGRPHTGREYLRTTRQASLAWIRGEVERSISLMKQACALSEQAHLPAENLAWTHFMLGEQLFQSGNVSSAEKEMSAALSAFPLYHRALAGMGQVRAAQHQFTVAADFYRRAIAVIPLPTYAAALGDIYHREKKDAEAEKQYALVEYIGQLGALNKQVYNRELALFFADHDRRLGESLALAQRELEVRHDVYTWDALAWALLKNNRAQEAHEAMQKALAHGTRDPVMFFHAAAIERKLGNPSAADFARKALAINPEFHVLYSDEARRWLNPSSASRQNGEVVKTELRRPETGTTRCFDGEHSCAPKRTGPASTFGASRSMFLVPNCVSFETALSVRAAGDWVGDRGIAYNDRAARRGTIGHPDAKSSVKLEVRRARHSYPDRVERKVVA
ncbi:MAG TPA: tetratricopeptide repeat protein [Terriglobales bacterium]|jgi:tetratricopeptide (TPR) repeat protein|nr:tetratricopeptide repeat protein [Terriglobales bacterium]